MKINVFLLYKWDILLDQHMTVLIYSLTSQLAHISRTNLFTLSLNTNFSGVKSSTWKLPNQNSALPNTEMSKMVKTNMSIL